VALAALMSLACLPAAHAQPDRPLRLIVPLAAGSTVDAVARALAPGLGRSAGHPVVVENIAGAGGIPGTAQLVRAPRDGLTLAMVSSNHAINPGLYKSIPYDSLRDITPIAVVATVPLVLVVHPSLPVKTVRELLSHARAHPGQLNYGSAGNGSTLHLAAELLVRETGLDMRHVPYRGTGPLLNDLIGGQVQLGFVSISQVAPHLRSGALRALAVSTPRRLPVLPDLPTLDEAGVPGYGFDAWIALVGPGGLPRALADASYSAARAALASPEARTALAAQGLSLLDLGPDAAPAFFQAELAKHQKLVRQSGAAID
jgi:tripartite-type tricarboxylate transporter receptor subunit TctC